MLIVGLKLLTKAVREDCDRAAIAVLGELANRTSAIASSLRAAATIRQLEWVSKRFPPGSDVRIHAVCAKRKRPMSERELMHSRGMWRVVRWSGYYDDVEVVVEREWSDSGDVQFFPLECVSK